MGGAVGTRPCAAGSYAAVVGMSACTLCAAGLFGNATGRANSALCYPCAAPVGWACDAGSTNATGAPCGAGWACPGGAVGASLCPGGSYQPAPLSSSCLQCPAGWACAAGSTAWNAQECGRGNYCPAGSAAPTTCGTRNQMGAQGMLNGPAFYVDTAACVGHCYNGGAGQLSTCA